MSEKYQRGKRKGFKTKCLENDGRRQREADDQFRPDDIRLHPEHYDRFGEGLGDRHHVYQPDQLLRSVERARPSGTHRGYGAAHPDEGEDGSGLR